MSPMSTITIIQFYVLFNNSKTLNIILENDNKSIVYHVSEEGE